MRVELGKSVSLKETSQNPQTWTTKEENKINVRDGGRERERERERERRREREATGESADDWESGDWREFLLFECPWVRWTRLFELLVWTWFVWEKPIQNPKRREGMRRKKTLKGAILLYNDF